MAIETKTRIGQFIRELREQRGWGLNQFADRAGVSRGAVSLIENGRRKRPDSETLRKMARALGVEANMLLSMAGYQTDDAEKFEVDPKIALYLAFRRVGFSESEASRLAGTFIQISPNFVPANEPDPVRASAA